MAKYGSDDLKIEVDNAGGTLVDMSSHVQEINGFKIEAIIEGTTPFNVAWEQSQATGVSMVEDIELGGAYDDTPGTGPDVIFGQGRGATRTVKITWGGTKSSSVEAIMYKYERIGKTKELTKYQATLKPTGAVTEA